MNLKPLRMLNPEIATFAPFPRHVAAQFPGTHHPTKVREHPKAQQKGDAGRGDGCRGMWIQQHASLLSSLV